MFDRRERAHSRERGLVATTLLHGPVVVGVPRVGEIRGKLEVVRCPVLEVLASCNKTLANLPQSFCKVRERGCPKLQLDDATDLDGGHRPRFQQPPGQ